MIYEVRSVIACAVVVKLEVAGSTRWAGDAGCFRPSGGSVRAGLSSKSAGKVVVGAPWTKEGGRKGPMVI